MPWVEKDDKSVRPARSREFSIPRVVEPGSRDPSGRHDGMSCFTQGIGLRPQPWAKVSRPVGPASSARIRGSGRYSPDGRPAALERERRRLLAATRTNHDLTHDLEADASRIVGFLRTAVLDEEVRVLPEGVLPAPGFNDFSRCGGVRGNDCATEMASIQSRQPAVGSQGRLNSLEDWVEASW